jgi:hypothetical protein
MLKRVRLHYIPDVRTPLLLLLLLPPLLLVPLPLFYVCSSKLKRVSTTSPMC